MPLHLLLTLTFVGHPAPYSTHSVCTCVCVCVRLRVRVCVCALPGAPGYGGATVWLIQCS